MTGEIKILFGEVVDITDPDKKFRCRVAINGFTDQLEVEDLPWYFPFGIKKLPVVGDNVGVIIFDNIITSGFYTDEVNLTVSVSDEDYEHYVELFDKDIDGNNAKMTFKPSKGIETTYGNSSMMVSKDKLSLSSGASEVDITDDNIKLGADANEHVLLGEKTIDFLSDFIDVVTEVTKEFSATSQEMITWQAACSTPFTVAMTPTVTGLMAAMTALAGKIQTLKVKLDTLKSDKVLTE